MIQDTDSLFSIHAAASECPKLAAAIIKGTPLSFLETSELARKKAIEMGSDLKDLSRPYPLVARQDLDTLVSIYALLEAKKPILLLHPNFTEAERQKLLERAKLIKAPLPEDTAAILFTSGTTGSPKPAVISRRALAASAAGSRAAIPLEKEDVWLLSISPARIGGFSVITRSLAARSTVSISGKFRTPEFLDRLESEKISYASIVPTMLSMIFEEFPDWRPSPYLKSFLVGGAAASAKLKEEAARKGVPVTITYGMTETASNVAATVFEKRFEPTEGCGAVNPGAQVQVRGERIFIRGPMLMSGYWGQAPIDPDEWFESGDLGEISSCGELRVFARRTDLIVSGGENVYPAEVEDVLMRMPGIKAALVAGLPDEKWGAIVCALLVAEDGAKPLQPEEIAEFLKPRIASYKAPRRIAWVQSLPLASSGKPDRSPAVLQGRVFEVVHYKS